LEERLADGVWGCGDGLEDVVTLLSGGGEDGSEAGEVSGALESSERAGDFHFDLGHPNVPFGQVVGERDVEVDEEAEHVVLEDFEPDEEIEAGPALEAAARLAASFEVRQSAMKGQALAHGLSISFAEGLDLVGRESAGPAVARLAHGGVGGDEHVAHWRRPSLAVEFDERLELAQMMGVAQRMVDLAKRAIGHEAIVHNDAAREIRRDGAALFLGSIEGEGLARGRVQPMKLARDPKTRLVEMADLRFSQASADPGVDLRQIAGLLANPRREARRAQKRRPEQVGQRLGGAIFGNELLEVEVDRRRLDPLAILRGRDHAFGERSLGHAPAAAAAINQRLVLGDDQRPLDQIEHLPRLDALRRSRRKKRLAMPAVRRLVPHDPVGFGRLPQRVALVALLPAARLARRLAKASRDPRLLRKPIARRRLRTGRTVLPQTPLQLGDLSSQRRDQLFHVGRKNHPYVDSHPNPLSQTIRNPPAPSTKTVTNPTHKTATGLGVTLSDDLRGLDQRAINLQDQSAPAHSGTTHLAVETHENWLEPHRYLGMSPPST